MEQISLPIFGLQIGVAARSSLPCPTRAIYTSRDISSGCYNYGAIVVLVREIVGDRFLVINKELLNCCNHNGLTIVERRFLELV